MSVSLSLLLKKGQPWAKRSRYSFNKSDMSDSLLIRVNRSQKSIDLLEKNCIFRMFFTAFPLFMPKSKSLLLLLLCCSFLKSERNNSLSSLFTKKRLWANHSHHSLQKSDHDGSDSLFFKNESLFRSQKTSDSLKKPKSEFPTLARSHLFREYLRENEAFSKTSLAC